MTGAVCLALIGRVGPDRRDAVSDRWLQSDVAAVEGAANLLA
jgi:hypothetical protein